MYHQLGETAAAEITRTFRLLRVTDGEIDLQGAGVFGTGATWTYLVSDDPFASFGGSLMQGLAVPRLLAWSQRLLDRSQWSLRGRRYFFEEEDVVERLKQTDRVVGSVPNQRSNCSSLGRSAQSVGRR